MQDPNEELSDNEEYETVIYKGPDQPYEVLHNPQPCLHQNVKLQPMDVRLAHTSAECGGLLSPEFFLNETELTSSISTRDGTYSESTSTLNSASNFNMSSSPITQNTEQPFQFPKVTTNSEDAYNDIQAHDIAANLERVDILDDSSEYNEDEWVEWPKKFIEQKGFRLGIQPGEFFKNETRPCFYVKVPHRSSYEVIVTNNNQVPCDLDLYVDGQLTNCLRLPAGTTKSVDGPAYSKYAFKLFRSLDVPSDKVIKRVRENGLVKAIFIPQKIVSTRLRSASEPFRIKKLLTDFNDIFGGTNSETKPKSFTAGEHDNVERSLDMSQVVEGVTLLQGKKKNKQYMPAPEMEVDKTKRVVLQLRLIASLTEEKESTEADIYTIEPPPLPSRDE